MKSLLKNNTGLDLRQLFIGTEGTLGVVTRAVLRLRPRPAGQATALVACPGIEAAARLLQAAQARFQGRVLSFEGMWPGYYRVMTAPGRFAPPLPQGHPLYALVEVECAPGEGERFLGLMEDGLSEGSVLDAVIASSEEQRRALWLIRESVDFLDRDGLGKGFDVSVPISAMAGYVAAVQSGVRAAWAGAEAVPFGHVGDNNIHWAVTATGDPAADAAIEDAVYAPLAALGGSVSAEHGIGLEKKGVLHLSRSPAELAVMRAVKQALDPKGILNPGKIL
jgi:FAD/FMN-containing dehydrogenase